MSVMSPGGHCRVFLIDSNVQIDLLSITLLPNIKRVNLSLAKQPLKSNGGLATLGFTSYAK